jgi:hypothetical protein
MSSSSASADLSGSWGEPVFESPAILIAIVRGNPCYCDSHQHFRSGCSRALD